jgi:hypothetical protein
MRPSVQEPGATPFPVHVAKKDIREPTAPFTGDEAFPNLILLNTQMPYRTIPEGQQDARWGIMEMANAQRGHWARLCPCPVYAPDTKQGPH